MNICHKDILLSEEIFQTDIWKSERRYLRSLFNHKGTPLLRKSERRYLRSLSKNGPRRTVGHIRNAGNGSRVIPMYPLEIHKEGHTRYGRPRRSLFSLKSPYLWDSTPDICVHILSRNVNADRNVTAYICVHTFKTEQIEVPSTHPATRLWIWQDREKCERR